MLPPATFSAPVALTVSILEPSSIILLLAVNQMLPSLPLTAFVAFNVAPFRLISLLVLFDQFLISMLPDWISPFTEINILSEDAFKPSIDLIAPLL